MLRFVPHLLLVALSAIAVPAMAQEETQELSLDEAPADAPSDTPSLEPGDVETSDAPPSSTTSDAPSESGKTATDEGIDLTLQDRIKAVSRKTFLKTGRFELTPNAMFTVNDPFFRTITVGGRVAWHLNEAFALEVGGNYVPPGFIQALEPVDLVREKLTLINADNDVIGLADVGLTFSPLYGKMAVFGDGIIHFDGFVSAGVGATFDNGADLIHPAMNVGVGGRIFLTRWLVLRGDLRDYIYPQDKAGISTLQNLVFVSLGLGFYFPLDFDYQFEAARVNKNG